MTYHPTKLPIPLTGCRVGEIVSLEWDRIKGKRIHLPGSKSGPRTVCLSSVARGGDPAGERAEVRGLPTLAQAFDDYISANPNRAPNTVRLYHQNLRVNLSDWLKRQLSGITRQDVEDRFHLITGNHGWSATNQTLSMLCSIYRRPCVDYEGLRYPVELWLVASGCFK